MKNERDNPVWPLHTKGIISYHNAGFRQATPQRFTPLHHLSDGDRFWAATQGYSEQTYADWLDLVEPLASDH